jgi:hypothetical protein
MINELYGNSMELSSYSFLRKHHGVFMTWSRNQGAYKLHSSTSRGLACLKNAHIDPVLENARFLTDNAQRVAVFSSPVSIRPAPWQSPSSSPSASPSLFPLLALVRRMTLERRRANVPPSLLPPLCQHSALCPRLCARHRS